MLCVSSSIAIYKAADLVSKLTQAGHEVVAAMTENAAKLMSPLTFRSLSKNDVITDIFSASSVIAHVSIVDWCDIAVVAPASYNLIGKIACGIADDAVTTIISACKKPVLFAPAMNVNMYENPLLQKNLRTLAAVENYRILEPDKGRLACGVSGKGRLPDTAAIMKKIEETLSEAKTAPAAGCMAGRTVLVTAGPTREYIDTVRFVSNPSSGRMGYAIAAEAAARGAKVILVSGPSSLKAPAGIFRKIDVVTTDEMLEAVKDNFEAADALIAAAAPCDFKFSSVFSEKVVKSRILESDDMKLVPTPDILKSAAKMKKNRIIVGFAAEDNNHVENALRKLKEKSMDMIVLNDVSKKDSGFVSEYNEITIIKAGDGGHTDYPRAAKEECAAIILDNLNALLAHGKR